MEIKILKQEKNILDIELDNLTIVEVLRVYLNKEAGIKLAAWDREHPFKNPVLHVETSSGDAKSAVKKAIAAIEKDIDNAVSEFKKLK
jgi:DNA-directed RNA polymerase subunit L